MHKYRAGVRLCFLNLSIPFSRTISIVKKYFLFKKKVAKSILKFNKGNIFEQITQTIGQKLYSHEILYSVALWCKLLWINFWWSMSKMCGYYSAFSRILEIRLFCLLLYGTACNKKYYWYSFKYLICYLYAAFSKNFCNQNSASIACNYTKLMHEILIPRHFVYYMSVQITDDDRYVFWGISRYVRTGFSSN